MPGEMRKQAFRKWFQRQSGGTGSSWLRGLESDSTDRRSVLCRSEDRHSRGGGALSCPDPSSRSASAIDSQVVSNGIADSQNLQNVQILPETLSCLGMSRPQAEEHDGFSWGKFPTIPEIALTVHRIYATRKTCEFVPKLSQRLLENGVLAKDHDAFTRESDSRNSQNDKHITLRVRPGRQPVGSESSKMGKAPRTRDACRVKDRHSLRISAPLFMVRDSFSS